MARKVQGRRAGQGVALLAAVTTAAVLSPGTAMGAGIAVEPDVVPIVSGLNGPRGISVDASRRVVYSESDGTISQTIRSGDGAGTEVLATVNEGFAAAISQNRKNQAHILTGGGGREEGAATLFEWTRVSGEAKVVADIKAYQKADPDPFNADGASPKESNPYGVATLEDSSALVADAAGNDLLRVYPNGDVETVARVMPRVVEVGEEFEGQDGFPPPGTPIPAEGVVTSVTVGSDGYYYIGELRGFPSTRGTSQIWRIEPDSVDAVCDPEAPDVGACQRFADGLTSIVDLAPGPDGGLYVLELAKGGWLQFELEISGPTGGLFYASASGSSRELADDQLTLPGGVDTSRRGKIFVAGPVFGEGAVVRVRDGSLG